MIVGKSPAFGRSALFAHAQIPLFRPVHCASNVSSMADEQTCRERAQSPAKTPLLFRAALPVLTVLLVLLGSATVRAGTQPAVLRVESNTTGEIGLEAHGVTIEEALRAIADEAGFEVVIESGIARPQVNMSVSSAPVEYVLRQILRGRNYSLVYDDDAFLSQVIVLPPPAPSRPGVPFRRPFRAGTARRR
jgi:hypothetical protein